LNTLLVANVVETRGFFVVFPFDLQVIEGFHVLPDLIKLLRIGDTGKDFLTHWADHNGSHFLDELG